MLLRQALEQTRTGMPPPVRFNSRLPVPGPVDGVSAVAQEEVSDAHFHTVHNRASFRSFLPDSAGQGRQGQPYRKAGTVATGAQAS